MSVDSLAHFAELLRHSRLLEADQLAELAVQLRGRSPQPRDLARDLLQRGWLTPYQINQLFNGRGGDLLLGSYVLIERLGAGGMGQVYKARNWKLGKIVALKLIRAERLQNANAIRRFQREARAAAQLNHPNIVHAYDCDEAGDKHFLVMEYVEGIDLAQLVKRDGPLPPAEACDYVRQAALGLQHAFERGLVHRDIKPHNLLRTRDSGGRPLVKVLDMGLARLRHAEEGNEPTSIMTLEGVVMGTLDYIAPEQARNAHAVDTRADLYSLGCTLYFLLAGQPPFPNGTATEKLLQHQLDTPTPIEQLRPDVPTVLAAVVRTLMAKRPDDRYQTPAEAAAALDFARSNPGAPLPSTTQRPVPVAAAVQAAEDTAPGWSVIVASSTSTEVDLSSGQRRATRRRRSRQFALAGGTALLVLAGLLLFLLRGTNAPLSVPATHPSATAHEPRKARPAPTFEEWIQHVANLPAEEQVKQVVAKLKEHNPRFDGTVKPTIQNNVVIGLEFLTDRVTDLRPVRALSALRILECRGSRPGEGRLSDLSPLKGMHLSRLVCSNNPIADLSPLEGMPLKHLNCICCRIADLSPLKGMRLVVLTCGQNPKLIDLSPLKGMPLVTLACSRTAVTDLTPLKGMPLKSIVCPIRGKQDREVLRSLASLQTINRQPVAEFWKKVGAP
jgi:serine/threonine-protein kinase